MKTKINQGYINHIVILLDASGSMGPLVNSVNRVVENLIKHLASRSVELNQETRITIYMFDDIVECLVYDKDVMRIPSIKEHYKARSMTALIDACLKSMDDLAKTPELYGDHAFLMYVISDGRENASGHTATDLAERITKLPDNWTIAGLMPDQFAVHEAKKFGFPADNISIWATTEAGLVEVEKVIKDTTNSYFEARATGVRKTTSLFKLGGNIDRQAVKEAGLKALAHGTFQVFSVSQDMAIREFIEAQQLPFKIGNGFYQLTKSEKVQPQKNVAVFSKKTGRYYTGQNARDLLGLPSYEVRVKPDVNPEYVVFVQSTSVNRRLIAGTKLLYLN